MCGCPQVEGRGRKREANWYVKPRHLHHQMRPVPPFRSLAIHLRAPALVTKADLWLLYVVDAPFNYANGKRKSMVRAARLHQESISLQMVSATPEHYRRFKTLDLHQATHRWDMITFRISSLALPP